MRWTGTCLLATALVASPAVAADTPGDTIALSDAWTPAVTQIHGDSPLYLTVANRGDAPDSLLRVRCPTDLADFTEKHVTDRGEGGTAMREVKSIAIPAGETIKLAPGGPHLMLLNIREPLREGQTFTCSVAFQKAGTIPVEVKVAPSQAP
ncbi:MAG TPA: copper chaperone PCu(A)C [Acetobacteraceae bacterium]|jgi:copper(I)-binding protein|nr:copper chaperone PCu(A)C [Acetobacteraceae bacterium]